MADAKTTALPENTTPVSTDVMMIVDDPGGTAASEKITLDNLLWSSVGDVGARVYHNADQAIGTGAFTAVACNSEDYDTHSFHDTSTNNSRLTVPAGQDGKYIIGGGAQMASLADGKLYQMRLYVNGSAVAAVRETKGVTGASDLSITHVVSLVATNYVELFVYQDSGGDVDLKAQSGYSPYLYCQRLA